jgi:hypothetical protein
LTFSTLLEHPEAVPNSMRFAGRIVWLGAMWVALVAGGAGCNTVRRLTPGVSAEPQYTEQDLSNDLAGLAAQYSVIVPAAADEITQKTTDRVVAREALGWKIDVVATSQRVAFLPNPDRALLGMVILAVGQRVHFTSGTAANVFAELQPLAVQAVTRLENETFDIAKKFLRPKEVTRLRTETEELIAESPGGVFTPQSMVDALVRARSSPDLAWVLNVPMVPFRALSGVSDTAQAINRFSETGRYFADTVAMVPQVTRWQLELALHDLEDQETVRDLVARWGTMADSAQEFADAAERLPKALREEASQLLAEAGEGQEELRTTLEQLAATATQVGSAGGAWTSALAEIRALQGPSEVQAADAAPGRPFDILDYESTAQQIKEAAAELRQTIGTLQELVGSSETAAALGRLDQTVARGEGLVDAVAWRAVQVLAAFFALLLLYRLTVAALDRRGGRQ